MNITIGKTIPILIDSKKTAINKQKNKTYIFFF